MRAELIEDRGEAAAGPEFFRSREFMGAEGVSHTLRIHTDGAELLAPLVVREVPGSKLRDAISPYGYPGLDAPAVPAVDPTDVDWSATGLVSIFIRHRLGAEPPLAGATPRGEVQIADPAQPRKSRASDRQQIRRNLRDGYQVRRIPGPRTSASERAAFVEVYEQTMRRTGVSERYFFDAGYFERILAFEDSWLLLALAPGGAAGAASIATRSDGMLHYYLSGSADSHLRDSPMKNVVGAMVDFAAELGLPLNLGGGVEPGDRLEEFKRGFANLTEPFYTSEIVCDEQAYAGLDAPAAGAFFPAYRAPRVNPA